MKAVILAGGLRAQLRPVIGAIPKPLLPIEEQAILEIQLGCNSSRVGDAAPQRQEDQ